MKNTIWYILINYSNRWSHDLGHYRWQGSYTFSGKKFKDFSRTFQDHYVKVQRQLSIEFRSNKQKTSNNIWLYFSQNQFLLCSRDWSFRLQRFQPTSSRLHHCGIWTWCRREKNHWMWSMFLFSQGFSHNLHASCLSRGSLKQTPTLNRLSTGHKRP